MTDSEIFLDTSIQIARFVHGPRTKRRIRDRLAAFNRTTTGLVARQEFRRRLLKEASYLLQLLETKDYLEIRRHVQDVLPPQQTRKRNICLDMLAEVDEQDDESDRTDRLRLYLKTLLRDGLDEFDEGVSEVLGDSRCACATQALKRRRNGRSWNLGTDKCSRLAQDCGIIDFIKSRGSQISVILDHLARLDASHKSEEIKRAEAFLRDVLANPANTPSKEPCLTVGDALLALESAGVETVYTMNAKESQHFCRALSQTMIIRKPNPETDDLVFNKHTMGEWEHF
jgi:hypothetical protein